eukprot:4558270-Amphidinium_carterae.1
MNDSQLENQTLSQLRRARCTNQRVMSTFSPGDLIYKAVCLRLEEAQRINSDGVLLPSISVLFNVETASSASQQDYETRTNERLNKVHA